MFEVVLTRRAERGLSSLPSEYQEAVLRRLASLRDWPAHSADVRPLVGSPAGTHRLRVGRYRAVLMVDESAHLITVVRVAHRSKVYG